MLSYRRRRRRDAFRRFAAPAATPAEGQLTPPAALMLAAASRWPLRHAASEYAASDCCATAPTGCRHFADADATPPAAATPPAMRLPPPWLPSRRRRQPPRHAAYARPHCDYDVPPPPRAADTQMRAGTPPPSAAAASVAPASRADSCRDE
jgi:hypothetical protein